MASTTMPPRPTTTTTSSPSSAAVCPKTSIAGRVVRLHFSCRAKIPIGSSLRVTTSLLDTTSNNNGSGSGGDVQGLYQTSVEMVTTPALYPVFRTVRPVILVLHHPHSRKAVQHYYYRYMIVSPAMDTSTTTTTTCGEEEEPHRATIVLTEHGYPGRVQFENPFRTTTTTTSSTTTTTTNMMGGSTAKSNPSSSVSLASTANNNTNNNNHTTTTTASLPYRMVDIRVDTASVAESIEDIWDNPDDVTFQPFRIRDAVRTRVCVYGCVWVCVRIETMALVYIATLSFSLNYFLLGVFLFLEKYMAILLSHRFTKKNVASM
jgi:hypothetical protein